MAEEKLHVSAVRLSLQHFGWFDYVLFVLMLTVCGGIGVFFGFVKKQSSTQDYLMGGRNMKLLPVCFSLVARYCIDYYLRSSFSKFVFCLITNYCKTG